MISYRTGVQIGREVGWRYVPPLFDDGPHEFHEDRMDSNSCWLTHYFYFVESAEECLAQKFAHYQEEAAEYKEDCWNGEIYKDPEAFESGVGICYIPENIDPELDGYRRSDFLTLVGGDVQAAERLFDLCDWQCPETLLAEDLCEEEPGFPHPGRV